MKKSKVNIEYKRHDEMENLSEPGIIKEKLERADKIEERVKPAELVSRAEYPIHVKYGKDVIRLSPRQRVKVANADQVESPLPKNVVLVFKK